MICCCEACMIAQYYQSALNRYQLQHLSRLKAEVTDIPSSEEEEKDLKLSSKSKCTLYAMETFTDSLFP